MVDGKHKNSEVLFISRSGDEYIFRNLHNKKARSKSEITYEKFKTSEKRAKSIALERGKILQLSIGLENCLESVIRGGITRGSKNEISDFVISNILNRLSLRNKFDIYIDMTKNLDVLDSLDPKGLKKLNKHIESLIGLRNRFAHGSLVFEDEKIFLRYTRGVKEKEVLLTSSYFKEKGELFGDVTSGLMHILNLIEKSKK